MNFPPVGLLLPARAAAVNLIRLALLEARIESPLTVPSTVLLMLDKIPSSRGKIAQIREGLVAVVREFQGGEDLEDLSSVEIGKGGELERIVGVMDNEVFGDSGLGAETGEEGAGDWD